MYKKASKKFKEKIFIVKGHIKRVFPTIIKEML